jgi:hypothetical protein
MGVELILDELKTHQRGPRTVLRSKSPDLVQQEIWGHLCCHYGIRTLMTDTARHSGHDLVALTGRVHHETRPSEP